jgi:predicted amidohydrolase
VTVAQTAPRRLETEANAASVDDLLAREPARSCDLVVLPELALTGYDLGHWAGTAATPRGRAPIAAPDPGPTVVLGFAERWPDGRVFNAAGAVTGSVLEHVHRKRYLPTYGMFDEGRVFAPGLQGPTVWDVRPGWPTSLLICEELWHPALPYLAALGGAALLLVLAAAPGRGALELGDEDRWATTEAWTLLARATALTHGVYVLLCNRAGVEGGVTFQGASLAVGPDGRVLARGRTDGPDLLSLTLDPEAVTAARRPYSHLRDEDVGLLLRELRRLREP